MQLARYNPFNRFVFDDNDFLPSTVTGRILDNAADCSILQSTSTVPEFPVTTAQTPSSVIFPRSNDPTKPLRILPQHIRPFPKAVQESNPKKRKTQGRTQSLTATPEKSAPVTERQDPSTSQNTKEKAFNVKKSGPAKRKKTTHKEKENVSLRKSDDETTPDPSHISQPTRKSRTGRVIKERLLYSS